MVRWLGILLGTPRSTVRTHRELARSGPAMLTSLQLVVVALAISAVAGCESPSDVPMQNPPPSPVSEFQSHLQGNGSITFRSWNGKALRMDSDTEMTFFPKSVVHMFESGYTLASYSGRHEIQPDGRITVQLNGFNERWPEMLLDRDATSLLLRPADAAQGFVMGTRGGAYVPGDKGRAAIGRFGCSTRMRRRKC
jgi:hypothetical protein